MKPALAVSAFFYASAAVVAIGTWGACWLSMEHGFVWKDTAVLGAFLSFGFKCIGDAMRSFVPSGS